MAHRQSSLQTPGNGSESGAQDHAPGAAAEGGAQARLLVETGGDGHQSGRAPSPFAWQHGTRLLLLDEEPTGWVMAELGFDAKACRYVEIRRATYRWPREAIGAVLSRALASGDDATVDAALDLHGWLSTHYGIDVVPELVVRVESDALDFPA